MMITSEVATARRNGGAEPHRQHRHDHEAAADAEEPGQRADASPAITTRAERRVRAAPSVAVVARRAPRRDGGEQHHRHEREHERAPADRAARERAEQRADRGGDAKRNASRQQTRPWRASEPAPIAAATETTTSEAVDAGADRLVEHVDQHRQREDRPSPADGADDDADREPEEDRDRGHVVRLYGRRPTERRRWRTRCGRRPSRSASTRGCSSRRSAGPRRRPASAQCARAGPG